MDHVMPQGSVGDPVSVWLRRFLQDAHGDILKPPITRELVELAVELSRRC